MSRHAGFGAVASITEKTINDVVASYSRAALGPFFFPLPTTINVGPIAVSFSGLMQMLAPTIELHVNPGNLVTVHFVFRSNLRAQFSGQPMLPWTVQLSGSVNVGLITTTQNNRIVLGFDTAQVVFQPLAAQVISGPPLPGTILNALQSPAMAATVTNFVQGLPDFTISPPMLTTQINQTQPLNLPWIVNPSWFTINLSVNKIAVRVLEKAITVGVDFAGLTTGNANNLIDLTSVKGSGSIYKQHFTYDVDMDDGPHLDEYSEPKGGNIAIAVNMSFVSAVVDQISDQISGTPISATPEVLLTSIAVSYSTFNKPLQGVQEGLAVNFHVYVAVGPEFGADGRLLLQVYLRDADGTTDFIVKNPNVWQIYVAGVEVVLPWWVDVAIVALTIYFSAGIPIMAPLLGVTAIALLDDVIPGLLANVESQAQQSVQSSANAVNFPPPWSGPLPNLTKPDWNGAISYVSFTPGTVDLALVMGPSVNINAEVLGTITPQGWQATDSKPIKLKLKLRDDLEKLAGNNLIVTWSVRRGDTLQVIATGVKAYNDPAGNGIPVPHHTPELYYVDSYVVNCTATVTLGNQVGDIWSGTQTIPIWDNLDRHHKYVEWGPHKVHFHNAGTNFEWWEHNRKSRIHRTAVSARCKMLRKAASQHQFTDFEPGDIPFTTITYKDTLAFSWDQLNSHRTPLCEYCFFGGPDKSVAFPEEDWF